MAKLNCQKRLQSFLHISRHLIYFECYLNQGVGEGLVYLLDRKPGWIAALGGWI